MCLIAFALNASSRWPLVIAANRDEFLDRPTLALARWKTPQGHNIISGRDLRAGGAWFGITPGGRIAFLTNVREPGTPPGLRSRGELVLRWLESATDTDAFADALLSDATQFSGFNLVVGDLDRKQWRWVSNRQAHSPEQPGWQTQALGPGVYGLSNASLDTPWPKTEQLKSVLESALKAGTDTAALEQTLWAALESSHRAANTLLPSTGVSLALEEALSSAFVEVEGYAYGTRSSALLTVTRPPHGVDQLARLEVRMQEHNHMRAAGTGASHAPLWESRLETLHWPEPAPAA